MRWHQKNVILASKDQVAIDAVAAKLMGFDPLKVKFIYLADKLGLGCGDVKNIQIVGDNIDNVDWKFSHIENTFASKMQKLIYWGPLKPLEKLLLRTPLVPLSYFASNIYHNEYWLRFIGKKRINEALKTPWGKLFQQY